jgi:hypothetical protein
MTIEVMKSALEALESIENPVEVTDAITALRQAISQPDCRGCRDHLTGICLRERFDEPTDCTNGDKFQALAPVRLYKVTP